MTSHESTSARSGGTQDVRARRRARAGSSRMLSCCLTIACACLWLAAPALAGEGPQWTVTDVSRPTNFAPGDKGDRYVISVTNTGDIASDGSPIVITDELPEGLSLEVEGASGVDRLKALTGAAGAQLSCLLTTCTYTGVVVPDDTLTVTMVTDVGGTLPAAVDNSVHVSGGGATAVQQTTPTTISTSPAAFGISPGGAATALSSVRAGAHPDLTTSIAYNTLKGGGLAGDPKDTTDDLPSGFAGDLVDTPSCAAPKFLLSECPIGTQVGVVTLTLSQRGVVKGPQLEPLYNLAPSPGEAARIGFAFGEQFFFQGDVSVRPGDYGLETTFFNAAEGSVEIENVAVTVWGVPADPVHDPFRLVKPEHEPIGHFGGPSDAPRAPYLTNPTTCTISPLVATFTVTSWQQPNRDESPPSTPMSFGPMVGCDGLTMEPSLTAEATTTEASAPTGLSLAMDIPQTYDNPDGRATSTLKRAVVTLPEGMTVNPSAGAGLAACSQAQYAEEGKAAQPGVGCPNESKLGTVKIRTPSLKEEASGSVFLAQPYDNPFGSLLALYVVARIPDRGVLVKAVGEVSPDPVTGRLVTTFDNLPPLPFTTLNFAFRQGATAPLVTPPTCESYRVEAALTPWATPERSPLAPFVPPFQITRGPGGGACPSGAGPFSPRVSAGTFDNGAGRYSPMSIRITRSDGEQEVTGFSAKLPPGLTANLTNVPFCPEAAIEQARSSTRTGAQEEAEPSCPAASQIGHTLVGAGVGSVLVWTPGRLYLAGPYHGAPLSVVAVSSTKVGPFDLGTVVVRAALSIDRQTAAVTVDPGASDPIPHIIKGIVVHVRDIRVNVDRPHFVLNPTNCERMTFAATVKGAGASSASTGDDTAVLVDDPFQAAECQSLGFKPTFKVATSAKTSKRDGASLSVKLTYPSPVSVPQANIRSVKVELPLQLPSRLTTLQRACLDRTFAANPLACPAESRVGHARAVTPILPVPLEGPAYFVSHGGAKFPELVLVLQGYGITIELHGETFISKAGITSSTFHAIPDQPVTSFELTLPQGPYSALAANGDLCRPTRVVTARKLVTLRRAGRTRRVSRTVHKKVSVALSMPTIFTAQNGAVIRQNTPLAVTGCHAARPTHSHSRRGKRGRSRHR